MANRVGKEAVNWLLSTAYSYLGQNMAPQAIILLELLDALQPGNQQALRMLAYAYLLTAQYQQVLDTAAVLERLEQKETEHIAYLGLLRARALWGLGETEESKTQFQRYMRLVSTRNSPPS